ncbi:MAG: CdaR family protein [Candidatus Marinimicrobia bacterium]|nr:CdaR family protein [Candidatus Neomarinimicrobiota bacterium]
MKNLGIRLGAIGLAGLLWLFVVSENQYAMVVDMPIEARNLPARHALGEEVPDFAKVRIKGTGRSLFKTIILKQFIPDFKLVLDLERISEEYDFILNDYFERYPQKVAIPSNFDVEYVEVIYPSSIHISLDEYKEKMVTVAPVLLIRPAPGYTLVGQSSISPETIKIAGSRNIVEGIGSVSTIPDTIQNATTRISLTLELASIRGQLIEYTPKTVIFDQDIQSISERIISEIPVKIKNERVNLQAFVSPQTVSLTVVGGTDFIAGLQPEDIEISIDFDDWNAQQQFYELKVRTPKDVIEWMDLSPTQIELVVTKRVG